MATVWIVGSATLFLVSTAWGFRLIALKKGWFGVVFILVGLVAFFFNPVANFVITNNWNHRHCEAVLEQVKSINYVGGQSESIKLQFGQPYRVQRGPDGAEYWGYRTCPWWVLCPDEFLGFEIKDQRVTKIFSK